MFIRWSRFSVLWLAAVLTLSACSHTDDADKAEKKDRDEKIAKVDLKKAPPICPQTAIVRELQEVRDYGREKPDPSQLVMAGRLNKVTGDCAYTDEGIDIKFELTVDAARGPRLGGNATELRYFTAVLDPQQNILSKNVTTINVQFSGDKKLEQKVEKLHVKMPLAKDQWKFGPQYQILVGFQLTQDQLDNSRTK